MSKEAVEKAVERSGLSRAEVARRAKIPERVIYNGLSSRATNETASAIARVLQEEAGLTYAERREVFWELVTSPGQSVEDRRRYMLNYADGDPMDHLREAARNYNLPRK